MYRGPGSPANPALINPEPRSNTIGRAGFDEGEDMVSTQSTVQTKKKGVRYGHFTLNHSQVHILKCAAKKLGINDFLVLHLKM